VWHFESEQKEKIIMSTETKQVSSAQKVHLPRVVARAGYFVWHLIEMCLAMCIGGIPLIILFFVGAAKIGYPDLLQKSPELSVLLVGFILALPMTAWMRFRGHDWQSTIEMASTTIVLAILLVTLGWLGILARTSLFELLTRFACPVMIIPMLFRLEMYTGNHASHSSHHAHPAKPVNEHTHHVHHG
jgi:glucose-6-phosphate-specific signal transduction histidine kinase